MKKFIVIPFGYEYNDNTYDREGFQLEDSRQYDSIEEANIQRLKLTEERIPELNTNYSNVLYCIGDKARIKLGALLELEDLYRTEIIASDIPEDKKEEALGIIAPYVYEIVEIDTEQDCAKTSFDGDGYATSHYSLTLNEDEEVVMHSSTEPAFEKVYKDEYSSWMPSEDDEEEMEYYRKYYINGEKMTQSEWREAKINQVIEDK